MRNQCQAIPGSAFARNSRTWSPAAAKTSRFCPSRPGILPARFAPVVGRPGTEGVHAAGLAEGEFRKQMESQTPLGRIGQPRDIAPTVAFLASEAG